MTRQEVRFPDGRECIKRGRSAAVPRQPFLLNDASKWEPIIPPNYCWLRSLCHRPISWRRCWWFELYGSYGFACFSQLIGRRFWGANRERGGRPLSNAFFMSWPAPCGADRGPGFWRSRGVKHLFPENPRELCFNEINRPLLKCLIQKRKFAALTSDTAVDCVS